MRKIGTCYLTENDTTKIYMYIKSRNDSTFIINALLIDTVTDQRIEILSDIVRSIKWRHGKKIKFKDIPEILIMKTSPVEIAKWRVANEC